MNTKAKISIDVGTIAPDNGLIRIWWWKDDDLPETNQEWQAVKPVWEILDAHQTFLLCAVGETIEVYENVVHYNFVQVH